MGAPTATPELDGMSRGYTFLEIVLVLALVGAGVTLAVDRVGRFANEIAARVLREQIVLLVDATRSEGRSRGGAVLLLHEDGRYSISAAGDTIRRGVVQLPTREALRFPGGRDSVFVRFGRLGIGRMASTTVTVTVGEVERALVLSSYGRVRRR